MEDKRTALAILLCMFVFMFWFEWVMAPYKGRPGTTQNPGTQTAAPAAPGGQVAQQPVNVAGAAATASATAPTEVKHPTTGEYAAASQTVVESELAQVTINHLGSRIQSYRLKEHKAILKGNEPLDLVVATDGGPLPLGVYWESSSDDFIRYELEGAPPANGRYRVAVGQELSLTFKGTHADGTKIVKTIKFTGSSYLFEVEAKLNSAGGQPLVPWIEWSHFDADTSTNQRLNHNYFSSLSNNKVRLVQLVEMPAAVTELGPVNWIAFGDKYFMASLIGADEPKAGRILGQYHNYSLRLQGKAGSANMLVYAGPKAHEALLSAGHQLERNVDLGWFAFIAHPLLQLLRIFEKLLGNYGLAIVLLTLVIKALFLPLTAASFKSMSAMQALQPEMKALRDRIKDPQQLNQEMMALYKKHGVNPMGGCFPMLIQLPVFLGLYNALNYSLELRHAPYALWINDLSSPERLEVWGIGIPVMVILMGLSMLIQQITTPSAADPQQKKIMLMIPVIFTISFVIFPFPSGLVLYWFINNIISIVQQVQLRSEKSSSPWLVTLVASVGIFVVSYLLTLI